MATDERVTKVVVFHRLAALPSAVEKKKIGSKRAKTARSAHTREFLRSDKNQQADKLKKCAIYVWNFLARLAVYIMLFFPSTF